MACSSTARQKPRSAGAGAAALAALLWLCSGCETLPAGPPRADDRYETCEHPEARGAMEQARAHVARGAHAEAVPLLRRALELCPENVRTHLEYVEAAAEVGGETEAAMRERYAAAEDDGSSPLLPYVRAILAEEVYTRREQLRAALERDRSFYWAHLSMARLQRELHNTSAALESLRGALSARPDFPEARLELAEVLTELGRYQEAEPEYANYLAARPTDRAVRRDYVRLLIYRLGRGEAALAATERLLADDPGDIDSLMNLAAIHWLGGRLELATSAYHRVLELDPTRARAVLNLANLYYDAYPRRSPAALPDAWAKARRAYRYYLAMGRTEGIYDVADYHLAVPFRIKQIDAQLGPDQGGPPTLDDF